MKIILDLCGGTGAWSKPYLDSGKYDVRVITLPTYDIMTYTPPKNVYGILAAPPCTMFSLARTTAKTPRDLDKGMEIVRRCLEIIWVCKPVFWAMENPKGLLRKFIGKPPFNFDPSEFGADYNKSTDIWGNFKFPVKKFGYKRFASTDKNTRKLPPIPDDYNRDKTMSMLAIKRSITNDLFAKEFFKKNK